MKRYSFVFSFILLLSLVVGGKVVAQAPKSVDPGIPTFVVIQFHSEHRCVTCLKIEELTKKTLVGFPAIPFKLINVDDANNEGIAERFEATGTALFLYNTKKNTRQDLTEFAFMNASNPEKFQTELEKSIQKFLKQ